MFCWESFSAFKMIARGAHEKSEMSIMFFAPKIYALIHIPASETRWPLATYVAHVRPRDFIGCIYLPASLKITFSLCSKRSTCGKSNLLCVLEKTRVSCYIPLGGKQKYEITKLAWRAKLSCLFNILNLK